MRTHSEEQGSGAEPHGAALPSSPSPDRSEAYDAIIIGSGLGGLSSASTLSQLAGMKCLIIEQHWVPGGERAAGKAGLCVIAAPPGLRPEKPSLLRA